jgi:hypothetical protein
MTGRQPDSEPIGVSAVRQVATLMAAAAITAPKSGGQLFLAGKPAFLETVIIDDPAIRAHRSHRARREAQHRQTRPQGLVRAPDRPEQPRVRPPLLSTVAVRSLRGLVRDTWNRRIAGAPGSV